MINFSSVNQWLLVLQKNKASENLLHTDNQIVGAYRLCSGYKWTSNAAVCISIEMSVLVFDGQGLFPLNSSTVSFSLQSNSPCCAEPETSLDRILLCFSFCPPIFSASPFKLSCNKNTRHSQKCWGLLGWIQIYFWLKSPCFFMILSLAETLAIPLKE